MNDNLKLQYNEDLLDWDLEGKWRSGPTITKQDLLSGRNRVEKISAAEIMGKESAKKQSPVFTFGKHKGKTWDEVEKDDPNYWQWCLENLDWFAKSVKSKRG